MWHRVSQERWKEIMTDQKSCYLVILHLISILLHLLTGKVHQLITVGIRAALLRKIMARIIY